METTLFGRKLLTLCSLFLVSAFGIIGCGETPASPSVVTGLRILGLKPSPSQPLPGDQITLDLLWADPVTYCTQESPCPEGRTCQDGQCVRDNESTEIFWLVVPISAWESTEAVFGEVDDFTCFMERCPDPVPCVEGSTCLDGSPCNNGFCQPCFTFESITICCGTQGAESIQVTVPPELEVPPDDCSPDTSIDISAVLQVQVQVCAGGRINLCPDDLDSLSFGCDGEGAETVTAISRINVAATQEDANQDPQITESLWNGSEWPMEAIEVRGCVEGSCADRACSADGDCNSGQVCSESRCREELTITLDEWAQEPYLDFCDQPQTCEQHSQCPTHRYCHEGLCHRIENPVTAFFATDGAFTPGRVVLDTTGDGRPNDENFVTTWLPPQLDACTAEGDPCTFGNCDPALGYCTGDVPVWVVIRDGRGGQDWIERTIRVVPELSESSE